MYRNTLASNRGALPAARTAGRGKTAVIAVAAAFVLSACAGMSDTQRRTATGAGIGSAVGAVIGGSQSGGKGVRNGALIGGAVAGLGTYIWSSRMEAQKRAMEESTQGTGVQVTQTRENLLQLDIPSDISFAVNSAQIRNDFRPILDRFAQTLTQNPAATVQIIGHTDRLGSPADNARLSRERAQHIREALVKRGLTAESTRASGRGERDPLVPTEDEARDPKNRRVQVVVR